MTIESEQDLYVAVGAIQADVRTLVAREQVNAHRITDLEKALERRTWAGAVLFVILAAGDPKQWSNWFAMLKGLLI